MVWQSFKDCVTIVVIPTIGIKKGAPLSCCLYQFLWELVVQWTTLNFSITMAPHHKKSLHKYKYSFSVCMGEMISKIWIGCSNMTFSFTWIYTQIERATLHKHTQNLLEKVKICTCTPKYWLKKQCCDLQWMWLLKQIVLFILGKKPIVFFSKVDIIIH